MPQVVRLIKERDTLVFQKIKVESSVNGKKKQNQQTNKTPLMLLVKIH